MGLAPTGKRRLATAHAVSSHSLTVTDVTSISVEEFVKKRIDFAILVIDRNPMRRSGELSEPISHPSGF
jgi:hypothetical protein